MPGSIAPFPTNPAIVAVAVAYRNPTLIADNVLPRVPAGQKNFKHLNWPKGMFFTVPHTKVGRRGQPAKVEYDADETPNSCEDYALDGEVPQDDIDIARADPMIPDPLLVSAEATTELIALDREIRVAQMVFNADNYDSNSKVTLAGNHRWDVVHEDSDPIDDIQNALDAMVMRGNTMVIGRTAFSRLVRHPNILKGFHGADSDKGRATVAYIRELFELQNVWVGEGFYNSAKKGQPANLVRVWGKSCALLHLNPRATLTSGTTYGYTAQFGPKVGGSWEDKSIGMKGGTRVRVGESVKEVISAPDLGYLIKDVIS